MRVLLLSPFALDAPRGNSVAVARLLASLRSAGITVEPVVLTPRPGNDALLARARAFAPDVVHAVHAFHAGPTGAWLAEELARPLLVSFRGSDADEGLDDPARHVQIARVAARARVVLVLTQAMAARIRALLPEAAPRVRVVHSGVDPRPGSRDLRSELGIAAGEPLVVQLAALRWIKALPRALELLDHALLLRPDLRYVLAGARLEPAVADAVLPALKARPRALYAGELPHQDALALTAQADVFLNTSVREGMSNALLEAMALGRAVVASDIPPNREAVSHGQDGLLFATPAEGAAQVAGLLGHPDQAVRLGAAARAKVARDFSVAAEVAGHLAAYQDARQASE